MPAQLSIVPWPQIVICKEGSFTLNPGATISFTEGGLPAAKLLQRITGLAISTAGGAAIQFERDEAIPGKETYHLDINPQGVRVAAATPAGLFYGAQTLRQMLPPAVEQGGATAPLDLAYVHIEDAPRYAHRGFLLDVSRHFFGVGEIKRILDLMALQKLNRFHWHLSDDQGWRIEIKGFPRLTEIGAWRKESQVGGWLLSRPVFDGIPHGGFYTQEEISEIVAYARERQIEIIPEIDAPGHAAAAIAAYPALQCSREPAAVRSGFTSFSNPMCVGSEFPFQFLEGVFSEVAALFPYRHLHIGGDEVNKKAWRQCPACRERMAAEGLKSPHALQTYFTGRLVGMLQEMGCQVIGWNEMLHPGLDDAVINQYWFPFGKKKTIAALNAGRRTVISDFNHLYLDYSYAVMPLEKTYAFEPHFKAVHANQVQAILGVEGALWTEYVATRARLDWQMFPRLLAVSEVAWSQPENKDYQHFLTRLAAFEARLEALGVRQAARQCYLQKDRFPFVPGMVKALLSGEHPAVKEYRRFNP